MRKNNRMKMEIGTGHCVVHSNHLVSKAIRWACTPQHLAPRTQYPATRTQRLAPSSKKPPFFGYIYTNEEGELCRTLTVVETLIGLVVTIVLSVVVLALIYVAALWVGGRG